MTWADSGYPNYLAGGGDDEKGAALLAFVVGVDPIVGLLFPYEVKGLVPAGWHCRGLFGDGIYPYFEGRSGRGMPG